MLALMAFVSNKGQAIEFKGDHCVAWKTQKIQFMFIDDQPVGKSCEVSVEVVATEDKNYLIRVEVPIMSFNSGEKSRDEDVFDILRGRYQPNILVETTAMSKQDLVKAIKGKQKKVIGIIQIGNKSFPVEIKMVGPLKGVISAKFSDFDIEPPKVLGGIIASVEDKLELHFKFNLKKIENLK
jgi:hypothetical protein